MRPIRDIFRSHGVLDSNGRHINGSDKETNHRYGDAYEGLLRSPDAGLCVDRPFCKIHTTRRDVRLVMEVGIADGSSLLAWRDVFPNALCVGMDVHHSDKAHGERIEFCLGDATRLDDCERAAKGRLFDLIVEDATHMLGDTLSTLLFLWPYIRPAGLYVIEEFANVGSLRANVCALWPNASVVETTGPFGGSEPLVALRKQA